MGASIPRAQTHTHVHTQKVSLRCCGLFLFRALVKHKSDHHSKNISHMHAQTDGLNFPPPPTPSLSLAALHVEHAAVNVGESVVHRLDNRDDLVALPAKALLPLGAEVLSGDSDVGGLLGALGQLVDPLAVLARHVDLLLAAHLQDNNVPSIELQRLYHGLLPLRVGLFGGRSYDPDVPLGVHHHVRACQFVAKGAALVVRHGPGLLLLHGLLRHHRGLWLLLLSASKEPDPHGGRRSLRGCLRAGPPPHPEVQHVRRGEHGALQLDVLDVPPRRLSGADPQDMPLPGLQAVLKLLLLFLHGGRRLHGLRKPAYAALRPGEHGGGPQGLPFPHRAEPPDNLVAGVHRGLGDRV
eukprot:RCo052839